MTRSKRRSPEQWQQLVEQQVASGCTQKDFCQQYDIRPATFGYWKRKLTASDDADSSCLDLSSALSLPEQQSVSWKIELDLGNGVVLRLNRQ